MSRLSSGAEGGLCDKTWGAEENEVRAVTIGEPVADHWAKWKRWWVGCIYDSARGRCGV